MACQISRAQLLYCGQCNKYSPSKVIAKSDGTVLDTRREPIPPPGASFGRPMCSSSHSWACWVIRYPWVRPELRLPSEGCPPAERRSDGWTSPAPRSRIRACTEPKIPVIRYAGRRLDLLESFQRLEIASFKLIRIGLLWEPASCHFRPAPPGAGARGRGPVSAGRYRLLS